MRGLVRLLWRPVLILAVAGALAWWILGLDLSRAPSPDATVDEPVAIADVPTRRWAPRETKRPAPGCKPEAERRCIQGDAWWIDSCGTAYARAEECGLRLCADGACEPEGPGGCGGVPVLGRCDGDVAETCAAGRAVRVDCGARERRCVMTEDGPACRVPSELDCTPATFGPPRCEDGELVACVDGVRSRFDCRAMGGRCGPRPEGGLGCIVSTPRFDAVDCDACGCEPPTQEELCDGRDNDGDGFIDEDDNCGEIPIEVFIVSESDGDSSFSDEDVQQELRRINRTFARDDDYGLTFRIAGIHALVRPEWSTLDQTELDQLIAEGAVHPARDEFYVPLVLTDEIVIDEVPRPGASTVPNGSCGRMRRTPGPQSPVGVVAIAKRRWPTTGAHEIGHFLGLCHTHGDAPGAAQRVQPNEDGSGEACVEPCAREGDGICDTAVDPGPSACLVDATCGLSCGSGDTPDATNVMAYYPDCRAGFSTEQALLMRTNLYLRRQWHACIWGDGCACDPRAPECPEGMTCRNFTDDAGAMQWRCGLEGGSVPRGPCSSNLDCSQHSVCIRAGDGESRCVRPCTATARDCDCVEVEAFGVPLCVADFDD